VRYRDHPKTRLKMLHLDLNYGAFP